MPARYWAVFVWRNIPSPTWLNGSSIPFEECGDTVLVDCIRCGDEIVVVDVKFTGYDPDILAPSRNQLSLFIEIYLAELSVLSAFYFTDLQNTEK